MNGFRGRETSKRKAKPKAAPFEKPNPKGMRHPRLSHRIKGAPPASAQLGVTCLPYSRRASAAPPGAAP